jgi:uncharacterized membrane protein YoaK (UPF0700 family)
MFSREGSARSERQNRVVAGYLAFVGGFVNSAGFVLVGAFTSHVTGNVGRLADALPQRATSTVVEAASLVLAFFVGAMTVGAIVESAAFSRRSLAYAAALAVEAILLAGFVTSPLLPGGRWAAHLAPLLLGLAMGVQNGLVTRLSGAVVRTTHLTGVITDLGIEAARWLRFWRRRTSERPRGPKLVLLLLIAGGFASGAVAGAFAAVAAGYAAMMLPVIAVGACAFYAARGGR